MTDSNECKRTVVIKAISLSDPDFTSESVASWLSELLITPNVIVKAFGEELHPEYVLVARFEKNEDGKFKSFSSKSDLWKKFDFSGLKELRRKGDESFLEDMTAHVPKGTRSIMEFQLQFCYGDLTQNGYFPSSGFNLECWGNNTEYSWRTTDKSMSLVAHKELMAKKLRKFIPFDKKVLWDYEQTPVSCQIDPEEIEVKPEKQIQIKLSHWKDRRGRLIKELNFPTRILVEVEKGEILGDDNTPIIEYKAPPAPILEDVIHVYNSCDILDYESIHPLDDTEEKDEIAKKEIRIKYDLSAEIDVNVTWDEDNENNTEKGSFNAKIQGELRKSAKYSKGGVYIFLPVDMTATYSYKNDFKIKNPKCEGEGYEAATSNEMAVTNSSNNPMAIHMKIHPIKSQFESDAPEDYDAILNQISSNMPKGLEMMQKEMMASMPKALEMVQKLSAAMPQGLGGTTMSGIDHGMGMLDDRYELVIVFAHSPPQTCIKKTTRCVWDAGLEKVVPKTEENEVPIVNNFGFYLQSKMGKKKEMSGSHQWEAEDYSLGQITINELSQTYEKYTAQYTSQKLEPFQPNEEPGGKVKINVSWNIKEL